MEQEWKKIFSVIHLPEFPAVVTAQNFSLGAHIEEV
jgi:hypothetical protein